MSSSDSESSDFSIDSIFENLLAVDFEEESDVEASARQTTSGADLGPAAQAQPVLEVEDLPYQPYSGEPLADEDFLENYRREIRGQERMHEILDQRFEGIIDISEWWVRFFLC